MVSRFTTMSPSTTSAATATATHDPIQVTARIAASRSGVRWPTTQFVTCRSKSVTTCEWTTNRPAPNSAVVTPIHRSATIKQRDAIARVDSESDGTTPTYRTGCAAAAGPKRSLPRALTSGDGGERPRSGPTAPSSLVWRLG